MALVLGITTLTGCNDKPEVQPNNYQVLNVLPNPASHVATLSVGSQINQAFTLQVFDTKGQVILEKKGTKGFQQYSLNLTNEPQGNYQVILKTDNMSVTQKLIKLGK